MSLTCGSNLIALHDCAASTAKVAVVAWQKLHTSKHRTNGALHVLRSLQGTIKRQIVCSETGPRLQAIAQELGPLPSRTGDRVLSSLAYVLCLDENFNTILLQDRAQYEVHMLPDALAQLLHCGASAAATLLLSCGVLVGGGEPIIEVPILCIKIEADEQLRSPCSHGGSKQARAAAEGLHARHRRGRVPHGRRGVSRVEGVAQEPYKPVTYCRRSGCARRLSTWRKTRA